MAESNRVGSRLMSFILLFDCQEAFHCCLVVACSNRINMISIQCHRVGEWSAGKPECGNCIVPVWGNHDYAGLNEVAIPFNDGKLWNFPLRSYNTIAPTPNEISACAVLPDRSIQGPDLSKTSSDLFRLVQTVQTGSDRRSPVSSTPTKVTAQAHSKHGAGYHLWICAGPMSHRPPTRIW